MLKTLDIQYLKKKAKVVNRSTAIRARKILRILQRDNFQCVKCGAKENLTIDHIRGRRFARHDNSSKYKLSACQTLCEKCHLKKNWWLKDV